MDVSTILKGVFWLVQTVLSIRVRKNMQIQLQKYQLQGEPENAEKRRRF